jgi:predicted enzyme related to lactoylglutathione lyase
MKAKLTGIILFVKDIKRQKKFYIDHFGLEIVEEAGDGWVLLRSGEAEIGLHKMGGQYMETGAEVPAETNTKLVFDVDTDLGECHQRLTAKNINVREIQNWENYPFRLFDGEDPEGNVFQLRQRKS